jgi:cadmium resistance protein CadD (predicted permease)
MFFGFLILIALAALLLDAFTTFHWGGAIAGCIGIALGISAIVMGRPGESPSRS